MDNHQALFQRISKLLALADDKRNSSEAEASSAAAKVQELLQMHGLSLAEVEAAGGKSDDGGRGKHVVKRSSMYAWQRRLMQVIAETNFCVHRISRAWDEQTGRNSSHHQLVGRRINVDGSQMVYDYLVGTMKRLVSEAGYVPGRHSERDYHIWLEACTERLCDRLQEKARDARRADDERKAKMAANGTGRELVLADVYGNENDLNNDVLNGYPPGTTAQRRREAQELMARQQAEHARLVAEGMRDTEAWYRAYGYGAEEAAQMANEYESKQARQAKRRGRSGPMRGGYTNWTRYDEQWALKHSSEAWRQGSAAGGGIGLDPQVSRQSRRGLK